MRGLEQASGARLAEGVVSAGPPANVSSQISPEAEKHASCSVNCYTNNEDGYDLWGGEKRSQESNTILIKGFYIESLCLLVRKSHVYQEKRR